MKRGLGLKDRSEQLDAAGRNRFFSVPIPRQTQEWRLAGSRLVGSYLMEIAGGQALPGASGVVSDQETEWSRGGT